MSEAEIDAACARLDDDIKGAIQAAIANIRTFHAAQVQPVVRVETSPASCASCAPAHRRVGLYVPGAVPRSLHRDDARHSSSHRRLPRGGALHPSPASDGSVRRPRLRRAPGVRHRRRPGHRRHGLWRTQTIPKVDKIFGPGNARDRGQGPGLRDWRGAAIDMPAGPSEVLVIADDGANPAFVAADLLSQAEHGPDSQVVLVTTSPRLADAISDELKAQLALLSRCDIAAKALDASLVILCDDLDEACAISNAYAPSTLSLQTEAPRALLDKLENAGSIFLGAWTPESVGITPAAPATPCPPTATPAPARAWGSPTISAATRCRS